MSHTIAQIASATGLDFAGDGALTVRGVAEPAEAGSDQLAVAMTDDFAASLASGRARAAVLRAGTEWQALGLEAALFAPRPRIALAALGEVFGAHPDPGRGIHPSAVVDPSAKIAPDARIGPFVVVGADAVIGRGARILSHVSVGRAAEIGEDAMIHAGVRIGDKVRIGCGLIAQANACIGADGFSFVTPERGAVESAKETGEIDAGARNLELWRINSLGAVWIGDNVEVGACSSIDRGTVSDTRIGDGTKIDNQVQIGHNVQIGSNCLICGHVGIAGSVEIGDRVVLGGKVGVADHVRIGSDSVVAGGSLIGTNVPANKVMIGVPAVSRDQFNAQLVALRRLPRLMRELNELRAKLGL